MKTITKQIQDLRQEQRQLMIRNGFADLNIDNIRQLPDEQLYEYVKLLMSEFDLCDLFQVSDN